MPQSNSLEELLAKQTKEGILYQKLPEKKVLCYACGHRCVIGEGRSGVCRVRFNSGGALYVPTGYVGALQCDPIEKKPFFHALPGAKALSFGMLGCDFHCGYCQNWITSQAVRDPVAGATPEELAPKELVRLAKRYQAEVLASTYNEPLITSEWAVEIFKEAKREGLTTAYISNGNGTPEVLDFLRPWVDLYKVDLKGFDERHYRELGGQLANVLATIRLLYEKKFWLEIVTLVIPNFNDSEEELTRIAEFLASISPDIPWHVTAFHPDYKMTDRGGTPVETLQRGVAIGKKAGLHFVYAGNLPGRVGDCENTYCPSCHALLVERIGFRVMKNRLASGKCPDCCFSVPGVWN